MDAEKAGVAGAEMAAFAAALDASGGGVRALAVTERHAALAAYDGTEAGGDLFTGMHPPPRTIRAGEELLAFGRAVRR